MVIAGGNTKKDYNQSEGTLGGKALHLELLLRGGFNIPKTFYPLDIPFLEDYQLYIVRSSAENEDGQTKTAAGKYRTLKGIRKTDLERAVEEVHSDYQNGSVVIQPDLSSEMLYSGVAYSNFEGDMVISFGQKKQVQAIVEGAEPETVVKIKVKTNSKEKVSLKGRLVAPEIINSIKAVVLDIERYFGLPVDVEFAMMEDPKNDYGRLVILQSRPLPNQTDKTLIEHELRRIKPFFDDAEFYGIDEIVLSGGNIREVLGGSKATTLSTSLFNYIFAGGRRNNEETKILGAMQEGRNEMGYQVGAESSLFATNIGGKAYHSFTASALMFRPQGLELDEIIGLINKTYLPLARGDPELTNYAALRTFVQFSYEAYALGLNPEPFAKLVEKNIEALKNITLSTGLPAVKKAKLHQSIDSCIEEIYQTADKIRETTAKAHVKAARLAFFALSELKSNLEELNQNQPNVFGKLSEEYGTDDISKLRDTIVYDESIGIIEGIDDNCVLRVNPPCLSSFELTQERKILPIRERKVGKPIEDAGLAEKVEQTRTALSYREVIKLRLMREYDLLKQLAEQLEVLSGSGKNIYHLELAELDLLSSEPILAEYRIGIRKDIKSRNLFPEIIFSSNPTADYTQKEAKLLFGQLENGRYYFESGRDAYVLANADQVETIPKSTTIIFVPDNIYPGSHLFSSLSDHQIPVISLPAEELSGLKDVIKVSYHKGNLTIESEGKADK